MFWVQTVRRKFRDLQNVTYQWIEFVRRMHAGTEAREAFTADSVQDSLGENAPRGVAI